VPPRWLLAASLVALAAAPARGETPRIAGTAVLRFVIAEDGRVKSSSVGGDLGDAGIERCLAGEVARWDFGASPGEGQIQVTYPVTFRVAR